MATLHLLRHAKANSKQDVEDHDRPLTRIGRGAARRLGKHLPALIGPLDLVLCSSALRTRETLDLVITRFAPRPAIMIEGLLYLATRERLIDRLRCLEEANANVIVIGHNPGLQELAMALADRRSPDFPVLASGKFPTAACASFDVTGRWSALGYGQHRLIGYVTPESLAGKAR